MKELSRFKDFCNFASVAKLGFNKGTVVPICSSVHTITSLVQCCFKCETSIQNTVADQS